MDGIFSTIHLKRGFVTTDEIDALKSDLNLWKKINLSFTPKFHMLYEHVPDLLLFMNGFEDLDEDVIERWHQIHIRHHSRITSLQSEHKQKNNQEKCEHVTNSYSVKEIITSVNNKTRRIMKNTKGISLKTRNDTEKKAQRECRRNIVKEEVEKEDLTIMPSNRDRAKKSTLILRRHSDDKIRGCTY